MHQLHAVSNVSPVADPFLNRLLDGISHHSEVQVRTLVRELVPPMLGLGTGVADIGWVCGRQHVLEQDGGGWAYQVLAAPVMAPQRYQRQPVYFGEIVVHRNATAGSLEAALDGRFVMNEPESLSGYVMLVQRLLQDGSGDRLRDVLISGSHLASLRYVADNAGAFACIDSTVIDMLAARQHPLLDEVSVVESLGPYPAPPLLVRADVSLETRWELLRGLKSFVASVAGRKLLYSWNVADVVQVDESAYDVLR